jgi:hypothetical protein
MDLMKFISHLKDPNDDYHLNMHQQWFGGGAQWFGGVTFFSKTPLQLLQSGWPMQVQMG